MISLSLIHLGIRGNLVNIGNFTINKTVLKDLGVSEGSQQEAGIIMPNHNISETNWEPID